MLPISLDCPFLIASKKDNPEKLHDTGQINVREYQRGNQKRTIQRNYMTQDK
jgi:hypothetical protein